MFAQLKFEKIQKFFSDMEKKITILKSIKKAIKVLTYSKSGEALFASLNEKDKSKRNKEFYKISLLKINFSNL